MANITTTNLSLQKPIDEHNLVEDINLLQTAHSANMDLLETFIAAGTIAINTNPSIVTMVGDRIVKLYACSAGSISTITGMVDEVPFSMVMMSTGASLALLNANSVFKLSADWIPNVEYSSITLVWNGTQYIELGRVTTA